MTSGEIDMAKQEPKIDWQLLQELLGTGVLGYWATGDHSQLDALLCNPAELGIEDRKPLMTKEEAMRFIDDWHPYIEQIVAEADTLLGVQVIIQRRLEVKGVQHDVH
jgi:hypothetical protein